MVHSLFRKYGLSWLLSASLLIFVSTNFVNIGNLVFNLLFSRWMGPAIFSDLALLLTIKLSILGVLNAVQFLVTEKIAEASPMEQTSFQNYYRKLSRHISIIIFIALPVILLILARSSFLDWINIQDDKAAMVFIFGFPFYLPVALWRGVAQGKLDVHRIIYSANAEMLIRLFGSILFWSLGFGLSGVMIAFVLSLVAAWWFAIPGSKVVSERIAKPSEALPWIQALPWAAIQLAVVLSLDGDVFVTKLHMEAEQAGYVASISLIQRIIFFASFALASIMLPQIIEEIKKGKLGVFKTLPIFGLICASSIPVVTILHFFPNFAVNLLFGQKYLTIAPTLSTAALSATLMTLNYFVAVFMMAHKIRLINWIYFISAIGQLVFINQILQNQNADVLLLVKGKLIYQFLSTFIIFTFSTIILTGKYKTLRSKS